MDGHRRAPGQAASVWSWGTTRSTGGQVGEQVPGQARRRARPPTSWATMNAGADDGLDAGEGVAEGPADGDGGVGEARRRREPVRGGDVAGDRERRRRRPPGADDAEDHHQQPEGGDDLAEPAARSMSRRGSDRVTASRSNIRLATTAPDAGADDLRGDVGDELAGGEPAEEPVGEGDDRVEVGAGHRPEGEDQRDEPAGGGGGVLEQLQPDVVGREALRRRSRSRRRWRRGAPVPTASAVTRRPSGGGHRLSSTAAPVAAGRARLGDVGERAAERRRAARGRSR